MVDPKELTDAERLKALMDQINEGGTRRIALLEQEKAFLGETRAFTESQQELLNINLNLEQSRLQVLQQQTAKSAEKLYNINSEINTLRETKRINKELTEEQEDRLWALEKQSAEQQKLVSLAMERLRVDRLSLQTAENLASAQQNFFKTTLGVSDAWKTTLTGAMFQSEGALRKMWNNTKGMLTVSNMLGSTWMKIVEMTITAAKEYDSMAAKIRQISHGGTGLNSLQQQTMRAHISMREFGVAIQDAGQSTEALLRSMASFSVSSAQNREALMRQTNLLQEVGVSAQGSAQAFNFMDKGLNMTTQQSIRLSNRLFGLSKALKQPPDVIFKDWEQASNELAKYGDRMYEVFAGLSAQAKNTGLAVSQLIGIAAQFDTFDQAGQAVGRLNAILGGPYLSAIEMVYATEAERITALRESISVSGRVFTQLSRHEQQAIAAAAGIRDMAQAAQLFGGSSQAFDRARASQEALEKKARESQSALNKLKMAAYGLAVNVAPLVEGLVRLLDVFTKIASNPIGMFLGGLIMTVAAVQKGVAIYKSTLDGLKMIKDGLTGVTKFLSAALGREAAATTAVDLAAKSASVTEATATGIRNRLAASTLYLKNTQVSLTTAIGGGAIAVGGMVAGFMAASYAIRKVGTGMRIMIGIVSAAAIAWAALNMAKVAANPLLLLASGLALGGFAASIVTSRNKAGVPHYSKGKKSGEGAIEEAAVVGENGAELRVINRGDQIIPAKETKQILAGAHEPAERPEVEGEMGGLSAPRPAAAMVATMDASMTRQEGLLQQVVANTGATAAEGATALGRTEPVRADIRLNEDALKLFILDQVGQALA